jgi:hypothetical protein
MNAFTIIKVGQEDKSAMQKGDPIPGKIRNTLEWPGSG